jgi:hypothetical protein
MPNDIQGGQALAAQLAFHPIPIWDPALFRLFDERIIREIVVISLDLQKEVLGAQLKAIDKISAAVRGQK